MGSTLKLILITVMLMKALTLSAAASALEEYREARNMYLFAAACRASYNDLIGHMAMDALQSYGWKVEKYYRANKNANMRFLLAVKNQPETEEPMYLIAVTGTETLKDVIADFSYNKVNFFGHTPEEIEKNASSKVTSEKAPLVHWGFFQYVNAAWNIDYHDKKSDSERNLMKDLLENPERKIYLVGHSLGGAVVTVGAAGLINMGIDPSRIEVVTFGAPAVGNAAFRREYEAKMNLTRVVMHGDPIARVLQDLVGGYVQFGKQINWNTDKAFDQGHEMALYLDVAMKNYYKKRWAAMDAGAVSLPNEVLPKDGQKYVYVLPLKNNLPAALEKEFPYMKEAIMDIYREKMPAYFLAESDSGEQTDIKTAAAINCQLVAVPEVYAYKIRQEADVYTIVLEQRIYEAATGTLVGMDVFSSSTRNMTPLESFMHNTVNMGIRSTQWLSK